MTLVEVSETCEAPGCDATPVTKGLCRLHYKWKSLGKDLTAPVKRRSKAAGLKCSAAGCNRGVISNGFCTAHYQRARKGVDLSAPVVEKFSTADYPDCFHPSCDRKRDGNGKLCHLHLRRAQRGTDMDRPVRVGPTWVVNTHGYINRTEYIDGKRVNVLQHRVVMAEKLGRALLPHENVHHINGDRADNRPENLELWNTSQPSGQRVIDKLDWAREIIAQYEKEETMFRAIKAVGEDGGVIR
jgi:hypothetical protein